MPDDLIHIGLAFLEGFALILSPCILPILPIMLSGSLTGHKSRPLGIISGFVLTFTLFTLFSKFIINFFHLNPDTLRNVSFIILILLGVMMMSTYLTERFNLLTNRLLATGSQWQTANDTQGGFLSGLLFGALVGIIWTPCAGPILAAVIVQAIIQKTTLASVFVLMAFAIGAGVPMLLIALVGRKVMNQFTFFREHTALIRKFLGVIIIASVIAMIYIPIDTSRAGPSNLTLSKNELIKGLSQPYHAPDFSGITTWINSPPLTMAQLRGKVVLIDFWTYSCINCIRTLPYLKSWYAKYHDAGFEIIGVHSPEFQFEHDVNNVKAIVAKDGITYPVALDNNFGTWQNFKNQYWPAHYLINQEGKVVYTHFGEGDDEITENNIRYLLGLKPGVLLLATNEKVSSAQTPETYLGYARAENFASTQSVSKDISAHYSFPETLKMNQWALQGDWSIYADRIIANSAGATIKLRFSAANVYAVMSVKTPVTVSVSLNDKPLINHAGKDVTHSEIRVTSDRLYHVLSFSQESEGYLTLTAQSPGLEIYTFTFG